MQHYEKKPNHLINRTEAFRLISIDKRMFKSLLDQIDAPKPVAYYSIHSRRFELYDPEELKTFFAMFRQSKEEQEENEANWPVPASDFKLRPVFKSFICSQWVTA
jgi:hypothetical protein